jgi:hypothetical protein
MPVDLPPRNGGVRPDGLGLGLISGLMLAVPLWAGIGAGFIAFFLRRPFAASELWALAIAGVVEVLLLRFAWIRLGWRFGLEHTLAWSARGAAAARRTTPLRRTGLLTVLAVAFLHYYYWDVQTQIAMLPTVTVFVPVPRVS